jgi:hypothetical protein
MLIEFLNSLQRLFNKIADYYTTITYFIYFLYICLYLGLADSTYEKYILVPLKSFIRIFIGLFLAVQFNPFSNKVRITEKDTSIIMASAGLILVDALFSAYSNIDILNRGEEQDGIGYYNFN